MKLNLDIRRSIMCPTELEGLLQVLLRGLLLFVGGGLLLLLDAPLLELHERGCVACASLADVIADVRCAAAEFLATVVALQ